MGDEMVDIRLAQLPVRLHLMAVEHIDGLTRELRWLAADESDTPERILELGTRLRRRSSAVMAPLTAVATAAHQRGEAAVDLAFPVPIQAADVCRTVESLLDEADEFCRSGGMLTLATPHPAVAYRQWFLGELVRQIAGEAPVAWPDSPQAAALAQRDSEPPAVTRSS